MELTAVFLSETFDSILVTISRTSQVSQQQLLAKTAEASLKVENY